jgi:DNA polymerase elongation subunit (family B)
MNELMEQYILTYEADYEDRILDDDGNEKFRINLWSLDKESNPWLIRIEDFPIFIWVELPSIVNGVPFEWNSLQASKVYAYICKVMDDKKPIEHTFAFKQKLYYYQGDKVYPMMMLKFDTLEAMNYCKNLLSKPRNIYGLGSLNFNVYEAHIDPIRKFMTVIDANFCSWLKVTGEEIPFESHKRISTKGTVEKPMREMIVSYRNITPVNSKECESWFVNPRIVSFDIETYTNNHKAMPNSLNSLHVCNIISCIYYEIGKPESRKKYVYVLGDSDPVEGAEVICVNTEIELIKRFSKLIIDLDPEIISGYNIFAYDYPYLENRLKTKMEDWPSMGRLLNKNTEMSTMKWKSGAYGYQVINILQMSGRMSADLLPIIKRDYKLDKYSLDFVSKTFIGREKHDVKPVDMFIAYEHQKFVYDKIKEYLLEKDGKNYKFSEILEALNKYVAEDTKAKHEVSAADKISAAKLYDRYIMARKEITRIVAYCIQDSDLVVDLFDKLNVWLGLNALSSVVGVTIMQLFTRGQQIRCLSQVFDKCFKKGIILDKRIKDKVFYNGGLVQHPIVGMHTGVVCLDFASLYPSIMRAYNICFTTLVAPELFDKIENEKVATIEVEQEEPADGGKFMKNNDADAIDTDFAADEDDGEDEKEPSKTVFKTYKYKWVNKATRYGVLPEIQDHLVGSRNIIKKELAALEDELEDCTDPKRLAEIKLLLVLKDKYSNALKVSANSLYGFLGAQEGGVLSLIEAAMCITSTGRKLINEVNHHVITRHNGTIVYGDSVTGDTSIFIKDGDSPGTIRFDEFYERENFAAETYHLTKECIDISSKNIMVWTEKGFTRINKIIRHKINNDKKMYRILTHTGIVDVTEDHSLVLKDGTECSPNNVTIGTELLHNNNQHTVLNEIYSDITEDEAWVMGFFLADGSCDNYECPSGKKSSWAINKADMDLLNEAKNKCPFNTKILDTLESSGVYKLVINGENIIKIVTRYREMFYNEHREKKVPDCILNAPINIVKSFWDGFYAGDGDKDKKGFCRFDQKGKQVCSGLYLLARKLGYNVSINERASKPDIFRLTMTNKTQRKNPDAIKVIRELKFDKDIYVYDLETENHHFAVGPGALVVHNTDSSMVDLHIPNMKDAYAAGLALAEEISGSPEKKLSDGTIVPAKEGLFPPPLKIEFEKLMKMLSIKKKKYAALLYDKNGEFVREKNKDGSLGELKILKRGIIVARRDTAKIVHNTYNKLLHMILTGEPVHRGYELVMNTLENLVNDRMSARENLSIIRSLGDNYKSDSYFMKVFGDELVRVGKPANPSDRLEYVIVKTAAEEAGEKDVKLGLKMRLIDMYEDSLGLKSNKDIKIKEDFDESLILSEDDPLNKAEDSIAMYPPEKIDYEYYIGHIMMASLDQLFTIGYMKELEPFKDIGYKPQFCRRKPVSLYPENIGKKDQKDGGPIAIIVKMIEDYKVKGYKVDDLKPYFTQIKEYYMSVLMQTNNNE